MKVNIEVTDTLGGEANYTWVRRYDVMVPDALSKPALMRRIKRIIGWSGRPCKVEDYGDSIRIELHGVCAVAFATVVPTGSRAANLDPHAGI
jgi:hypothetical protein